MRTKIASQRACIGNLTIATGIAAVPETDFNSADVDMLVLEVRTQCHGNPFRNHLISVIIGMNLVGAFGGIIENTVQYIGNKNAALFLGDLFKSRSELVRPGGAVDAGQDHQGASILD